MARWFRRLQSVDSPIDPDLALVARCKDPTSDDFEAAFEVLYTRYRDRVYSIAYRVTGTSADAMDVVQETFSTLFRKIGEFRGESLFSTWLFRVVVNCAIDSRRQRGSAVLRRTRSLDRGEDDPEPFDEEAPSPVDLAQTGELGDHVHQCLQRLSPKFRAILVLRYLEDQSYEDLCETLDLSMGTVKSRLARAHIALQRELSGTLERFGYRAVSGGNYSLGSGKEGAL